MSDTETARVNLEDAISQALAAGMTADEIKGEVTYLLGILSTSGESA